MDSKTLSDEVVVKEEVTYAPSSAFSGLVSRWKLILPFCLAILLLMDSTRELVVGTLSDAFFQVGVFVAGTLAVYHFARYKLSQSGSNWLKAFARWKVPYAALLGCLPGCGGAIIVVTQFLQGQLSFGAVVAVLTATMGDAAFLLIAARPFDGITVMLIAFVTGVISGVIIDKIHGKDFMCGEQVKRVRKVVNTKTTAVAATMWKLLLIPGVAIGLLMAMQMDVGALIGVSDSTIAWVGAALGVFAILLWALGSQGHSYQEMVSESVKKEDEHWAVSMAQDTNFVLAWVVVAFLVFELAIHYTGFDLGGWLSQFGPLLPLMAIVVGFLPGCGPQILVTSIYLQGAIPFSAQLGNAISNDGDALFPAIAMAPKMAVLATLYSAVPAIVVAYGYYFLFE